MWLKDNNFCSHQYDDINCSGLKLSHGRIIIRFWHTKNLELLIHWMIIHLGQEILSQHDHFCIVSLFIKINTEGYIIDHSIQIIYTTNCIASKVQNNCVTVDMIHPMPTLLNDCHRPPPPRWSLVIPFKTQKPLYSTTQVTVCQIISVSLNNSLILLPRLSKIVPDRCGSQCFPSKISM